MAGCGEETVLPPGSGFGVVSGIITNSITGAPIATAGVRVGDPGFHQLSAADGTFRLEEVPAGEYAVTSSGLGYLTFEGTVTVRSDEETHLAIELTPAQGIPEAPTNVHASPGGERGSIELTWAPVDGADAYHVYWATSPGVDPATASHAQTDVPVFTLSNLTAAQTVYFVVSSSGPAGEGPGSPEVNATPNGDVVIRVHRPAPGSVVAQEVDVVAHTLSVFALQSVEARVDDAMTTLVYSTDRGRWEGTLSLAGLPSPSLQTITMSAADVNGDTARASVVVQYDLPPIVNASLPLQFAVGRPTLDLEATCTDDAASGCSSLVAFAESWAGSTVIASGTDRIDQAVSLAAYDGQSIRIMFSGKDEAGQAHRVRRQIYVESSPLLDPVAEAPAHLIVDAGTDRLLAVDTADAGDRLVLFERPAHTATLVFARPGHRVRNAVLTPSGVIFEDDPSSTSSHSLYEWRAGALTTIATGIVSASLRVAGGYAIWEADGSSARLLRRDLQTGATITVDSAVAGADLEASGDVAYSRDGDIHRFTAGSVVRLTNDFSNAGPLIDGDHVVYAKNSTCCAIETFDIARHDGSTESILVVGLVRSPSITVPYLAAGEWIAFVREDASGIRQLWLRSPAGAETQVATLGLDGRIESIGPDGEVIYVTTPSIPGNRYRVRPGEPPQRIGSALGSITRIDGQLYIMVGSTLFRVP